MLNEIYYRKNKSLSELEFIPGKLTAFDNNDADWAEPFILTIPEKLTRGYESFSPNKLRLLYVSLIDGNIEREEWTLHSKGRILGLRGKDVLQIIDGEYTKNSPYLFESAYSGRDKILEVLKNNRQGLDSFVEHLGRGKIVEQLLSSPLKIGVKVYSS